MSKISVSIPENILSDIDRVSAIVGFSRSALITYFMMGPMNQIIQELGGMPLDSPEASQRRLRGEPSSRSLQDLHELMVEMGADIYVSGTEFPCNL